MMHPASASTNRVLHPPQVRHRLFPLFTWGLAPDLLLATGHSAEASLGLASRGLVPEDLPKMDKKDDVAPGGDTSKPMKLAHSLRSEL